MLNLKKSLIVLSLVTLFTPGKIFAQEVVSVDHFDKVIISPHVQVVLTKGDKESVTIENCTVNRQKVNIESKGNTLRVYLEGAKEITGNEKTEENGRKIKKNIYTGTVLTVSISYKTLQELSLRGEETIRLKSKLDQESFHLLIYGEAKVSFDDVQLKKLGTTIYGESTLEIKSGNIIDQRFTAYGESKINTLAVTGKTAKATLYGESQLELNVSDLIKVTAFGEAKIGYKGNPQVKKGIVIGKAKIYQIN